MKILEKKYVFPIIITLQILLLISSLFYLYQKNEDNQNTSNFYILKNIEQFVRIEIRTGDSIDYSAIRKQLINFTQVERCILYRQNIPVLVYPDKESSPADWKYSSELVNTFQHHATIALDTTVYDLFINLKHVKSHGMIILLVIVLLGTLGISLWLYLRHRLNHQLLMPLLEALQKKEIESIPEFGSPGVIVYEILKRIKEQDIKINNLEERILFLNHILDEINEPLLILNHEFEIIYANNRINAIIEVEKQADIDLREILKGHYDEVISLLQNGKQINDFRIKLRSAQADKYFLMNARMFQHRGKIYYVLIFDDKTEMILTQENLQETKLKLEKLNNSYARKIIQLEQERYKNEKHLFYRYFLLETISDLARADVIEEIGQLLIRKMQNYFNISFGAFYLSENNRDYKLITSKNFSSFKIETETVVHLNDSQLEQIFTRNFPSILDEANGFSDELKFFNLSDGLNLQGLVLPIKEHEQNMGFLLIFKFPEELFSMDEINVLDAMSKHISIILYNRFLLAELNEKTRKLENTLEELKESQERVLQLQKMESLERLVGGIAHDFNNILGIIIPTSELLLLHSQLSDEDKEKIEMIRDAAKRGSYLTRQFLVFGKEQKSILYPLNLNKYIEESMFLFSKMLDQNIKLIFRPCPRDVWVEADTSQIFQVISNLIINAVDAIKEKNIENGKIELGIFDKNHPDFLKYLEHIDFANEAVGFYVKDNGPGIPEKIRSRIFDPFFSTKERHKGSGLGLSIVYAIVKNQHKGEIFVDSAEGKGATFIVILPEIKPKDTLEAVHKEPDFLPTGSESILIIDDEEYLSQSLRLLFEKLGYTTFLAGRGDQGVEILKRSPEIDLAIVDLAMPGMNGIETIRELKKIKKDMGIILITGYLEEINNLNDTDFIDDICLKPFDIYELSTIVRKLLDKKVKA